MCPRPMRPMLLTLAVLLIGCGSAATATLAPVAIAPTAPPTLIATIATIATPPAATATPTARPATPPLATTAASSSASPGVSAITATPPLPTIVPTSTVPAPTPVPPTAAPAAPRTVATGRFVRKDYNGSGEVSIVVQPDGSATVRFANFNVDNGPRLVVYLTKEASPSRRADVDRGYLDLGALTATRGNLEYAIPTGINLAEYNGVVVYCAEFHVVFVAATLAKQ